ncbi:Pentatricopeptide repeat-containing protein [Nymphaea thermarum]|nr:Pentatricopeptide repeat-containing protein [Nymphaea thermarum]
MVDKGVLDSHTRLMSMDLLAEGTNAMIFVNVPPSDRLTWTTKMMPRQKYYVAFEERERGIYDSWERCQPLVYRYKGAVFKSFDSLEVAENHMYEYVQKKYGVQVIRPPLIEDVTAKQDIEDTKEGNLRKAFGMVNSIMMNSYFPNPTTFNSLIGGFCKHGETENAVRFIAQMDGLCVTNRIGDGFKLLQFMKNNGFEPNTVIYNTLIYALCKNGKVGRGRSLLREMAEPSVVTFNILISAYYRDGDPVQAMVLLGNSLSHGFVPDVITVTKLVECFCDHGRVREAVEVLQTAEEKGVVVDTVTYNTLINGFCRNEEVEFAVGFTESFVISSGMVIDLQIALHSRIWLSFRVFLRVLGLPTLVGMWHLENEMNSVFLEAKHGHGSKNFLSYSLSGLLMIPYFSSSYTAMAMVIHGRRNHEITENECQEEQMLSFGWTIEELIVLTLILSDVNFSWFEQLHGTGLPRQASAKELNLAECRRLIIIPSLQKLSSLKVLHMNGCGHLDLNSIWLQLEEAEFHDLEALRIFIIRTSSTRYIFPFRDEGARAAILCMSKKSMLEE